MEVDVDRYFNVDRNIRRGRSVKENLCIVPRRYKTVSGQSFFTNRILKMWYALPDNIRNINPPNNLNKKPNSFKYAVEQFYFNKLVVIFDVNNVCSWTTTCLCNNCRL